LDEDLKTFVKELVVKKWDKTENMKNLQPNLELEQLYHKAGFRKLFQSTVTRNEEKVKALQQHRVFERYSKDHLIVKRPHFRRVGLAHTKNLYDVLLDFVFLSIRHRGIRIPFGLLYILSWIFLGIAGTIHLFLVNLLLAYKMEDDYLSLSNAVPLGQKYLVETQVNKWSQKVPTQILEEAVKAKEQELDLAIWYVLDRKQAIESAREEQDRLAWEEQARRQMLDPLLVGYPIGDFGKNSEFAVVLSVWGKDVEDLAQINSGGW